MFLTQSEISKDAKIEIDVDTLQSFCGQCKLDKNCKSPRMEFSGSGEKGILIIGDVPSEKDDHNRIQFSGESGVYLKETLQKNKISMNRDCWKVNAVRCNIPGYNTSVNTTTYSKLCSGYIIKLLLTLKPKFVIILGGAGINSILGDDFSNREVERWRGTPFFDEKYQTTFFCTFHPREIQIEKFNVSKKIVFENDIRDAILASQNCQKLNTDQDKHVKHVLAYKDVVSLLERIIKDKPDVYHDYETSGLKPYRPGHFIACIGIALSPTEGYSFPFYFNNFWKEKEYLHIKQLWTIIMSDKDIHKIAHNAKFEDCWANKILETTATGWLWCTMLTSHVMDNRSEFVGLKFQAFLKFGRRPYDKHLEKFIKSNSEFNTVHKAPLRELLTYCGLDCIYGYMLYEFQKSKLAGRKGLIQANTFLFKSSLTMSRIQQNGICMNEKYYEDQRLKLTYKINKYKRELMTGREATKFREKFGRTISLASGPDLGKLLFEVLGHPPIYTGKANAKGVKNYKTDKDTMAKLNIPFAKKLVDMKKLIKARDTYLAQFSREVYEGRMHPFFDLHIPATYRSSSSKPNFQNQPKRDEEIKNAVRSGIEPDDDDDVLSEIDFSGAEVITSACFHKDPTFIAYLMDKESDMHRDVALDIWQLDVSELVNPNFTRDQQKLAKKIRFYAKNNWTFAEFYGDWYDSCARNLWENCIVQLKLKLPSGKLLEDHCKEMKIYSLEDFIEHCKGVEDRMWNERFPVYTRWKKNVFEFYKKKGYIETMFGFRFTGYLDRKQCANYPIQGTSFHLLLYTLMQVEKFLVKNNMKTKIIGQIHDSIVANVPKNEIEMYHRGVSAIINSLHSVFGWLVVPMEAECSITKLKRDGGNFSKLWEIKPEMLDGTKKFNLQEVYA